MRILIVHKNFPAQFRHLAEFFGRETDSEVVFLTQNLRPEWVIPGVKKVLFSTEDLADPIHSFAHGFDAMCRQGVAVLEACKRLRSKGFIPDVIIGHSGWGQTIFLRDVYPDAAFVGYFEWYYNAKSKDSLFDGKTFSEEVLAQMRCLNTPMLHDLVSCDQGVTPTNWQRCQFPLEFQKKLVPVHEGINTQFFCPKSVCLDLPGIDLTGAKELVTYCSRGLEPYRGFPQFYESLPSILEARPGCHVLIVGEDRVCYGSPLPEGRSYKHEMMKKVSVDKSRVHFTGSLPYGMYRNVLQASSVHVYLTRPFVLSWSLLEAMSCGCLIVASNTDPVTEVIRHGTNGLLTSFNSPNKIALDVISALADKRNLQILRDNARSTILERYSVDKCLPTLISMFDNVLGKCRTTW